MDWPAARVQKVQRVLPASSGRVQRVLYRLTAMKFYGQRYGTYYPPNTARILHRMRESAKVGP